MIKLSSNNILILKVICALWRQKTNRKFFFFSLPIWSVLEITLLSNEAGVWMCGALARASEDNGITDWRDFISIDYISIRMTDAWFWTKDECEESILQFLMDDEMMQVIVDETNRYHGQHVTDQPQGLGKMKVRKDVGLKELSSYPYVNMYLNIGLRRTGWLIHIIYSYAKAYASWLVPGTLQNFTVHK